MVLCFYSRSIIASKYLVQREILYGANCCVFHTYMNNRKFSVNIDLATHRTQVAGPLRAHKADHTYYTYLKVHTRALEHASTRTRVSRVPFALVCEHQSAQVTSSLLALV